MDKTIVAILTLSKETKNRYKYADDNWKNGQVSGNLYPLKDLIQEVFGPAPQRIKITIERA